jgi:DNA-binding PadR family transcriptional regulator
LHRLEQAGLLASRWVTAESGRQRQWLDAPAKGDEII